MRKGLNRMNNKPVEFELVERLDHSLQGHHALQCRHLRAYCVVDQYRPTFYQSREPFVMPYFQNKPGQEDPEFPQWGRILRAIEYISSKLPHQFEPVALQ